jgi:hypothetical protein
MEIKCPPLACRAFKSVRSVAFAHSFLYQVIISRLVCLCSADADALTKDCIPDLLLSVVLLKGLGPALLKLEVCRPKRPLLSLHMLTTIQLICEILGAWCNWPIGAPGEANLSHLGFIDKFAG